MFSCGTLINFTELNKSEGNILVSKFIEETNEKLKNTINYVCYDNACHIAGLSEKLKNKTFVIGKLFMSCLLYNNFNKCNILYKDRLHLFNHTQSKCKSIHNCDSYSELAGINTIVCEQKFYLISRYKHMVKHMTQFKFNFFFLELFDMMNENNFIK